MKKDETGMFHTEIVTGDYYTEGGLWKIPLKKN